MNASGGGGGGGGGSVLGLGQSRDVVPVDDRRHRARARQRRADLDAGRARRAADLDVVGDEVELADAHPQTRGVEAGGDLLAEVVAPVPDDLGGAAPLAHPIEQEHVALGVDAVGAAARPVPDVDDDLVDRRRRVVGLEEEAAVVLLPATGARGDRRVLALVVEEAEVPGDDLVARERVALGGVGDVDRELRDQLVADPGLTAVGGRVVRLRHAQAGDVGVGVRVRHAEIVRLQLVDETGEVVQVELPEGVGAGEAAVGDDVEIGVGRVRLVEATDVEAPDRRPEPPAVESWVHRIGDVVGDGHVVAVDIAAVEVPHAQLVGAGRRRDELERCRAAGGRVLRVPVAGEVVGAADGRARPHGAERGVAGGEGRRWVGVGDEVAGRTLELGEQPVGVRVAAGVEVDHLAGPEHVDEGDEVVLAELFPNGEAEVAFHQRLRVRRPLEHAELPRALGE